jgi:hypothetical protein
VSLDLGSSAELTDLVKLIGLVDASGNIDTSWFANPLAKLSQALRNETQRQALTDFLDHTMPPADEPGLPAGEKWHPLLGAQSRGNLYLTVRDTGSGLVVGIAGDLHSSPTATVPGRLRIQGDLIAASSTVDLVVGTSTNPIVAEARIETGWTYNPGAGHPVGLGAIVARFAIVPDPGNPSIQLRLVLEQLSLHGEPAVDKVVDVTQLGHEAPDLVAALVKVVLASTTADPTVTMLADHLLALLGLGDGGGIPAFPVAELTQGPVALQQWIASLIGTDGTAASIGPWLGHLAGLLGQTGPVTGTGQADDPWQATLTDIDGIAHVAATLAQVPGHLRVGVSVVLDASLGVGEPHLGIQARVSIADIPLGGTAHARALPDAAVLVRITGDAGGPLVSDATVTVGTAQCGLSWDGTRLAPVVELLGNAFAGTPYPRLDLTNAESVESAATNLVVTAISNALGGGIGRRIAAIVGLVPPEDPAAPGTAIAPWPHQLDLATLVVNPTRAIAGYHLAVLGDGDRWSLILREIAHLVGITTAVSGTGTPAQPWTVPIAATGGAELQLAAWHAPAPAAPSTTQLRIGLRLAANPGGATLAASSEVLGFDLSPTGAAAVRMIGRQELVLSMAPVVDASIGPIEFRLDALGISAGWEPGAAFAFEVHAQGLALTVDGQTIAVADLHFPPPGGFDLTNLSATAGGLGLSMTQLEQLFTALLSLLASLAGSEAEVAAALLGLHGHLPGLNEALPSIVDPAVPGLLLRDPLGALRAWLGRAVADVGASGESSLFVLLGWLAALAAGQLDAALDAAADVTTSAVPLDLMAGAGTFAHPWRMQWPGGVSAGPDLELWLDPAGPPSSWLAGLSTRAGNAIEYADLADVIMELASHDDAIGSLVVGLSRRQLVERLRGLAVYLGSSDGVVPRDSQSPDIFGWVSDAEVNAAHHTAPAAPDAITAVLQQIETLRDGGERIVLLVGPAFADHTIWADLLAAPQRQGTADAGAYFNLRTQGIDPTTISLDAVTAVADYYTADLADDGHGNPAYLVGQIAHIADRLATLHPGPITIVAHSYAGLAARAFAAAHADRVQGLITIATPHLGSPLSFRTDTEIGDALRIAAVLRPTMSPSATRDAVDHLLAALEGYLPPASAGALATPNPYPAASFALAAPFDLGTVPIVTVTATLSDDPFEWLSAALVAHINDLTSAGRPAPTHLAYGIAMDLPAGTGVANVPDAAARVRFALGQIALGGSAPVRPAQLIRVELDLFQSNGWVVGGPADTGGDGRVRRVQIGVTAQRGSSGTQATVDGTLSQAAWRGTTTAQIDLSAPRSAPLVGAAFAAVLASTDTADTAISPLAAALSPLGLISTDASGITGLSTDAFAALRTDPVGYLGGRIPAALARPDGWAGLAADASLGTVAYSYAPGGSPYALFVAQSGTAWRTGIETSTASAPTSTINLGVDLEIDLPAFEATAELFLNVGAVSMHYRTADGTIALDADPWVHDVVLWPTPSLADIAARLNDALPHVLVSGALGGALSQFVPGLRVRQLELLLRGPGEFLADVSVFGAVGGGFDPARLGQLVTSLNGVLGLPTGPGLQLPGDVSITVGAGSAAGSTRMSIATTTPIGGDLQLGFFVDVDALRHVSPGGTVTITTPLAGGWPSVAIAFGVTTAGVSLVVTPQGVPPITLLPTFSGLGSLLGAATALLPAVLDAAVHAIGTPQPTWLTHILAAAGHLGLYDSGGGFAAHADTWRELLHGTLGASLDSTHRAGAAAAVVDLITIVPGLPGTLTSTDGLVQWAVTLPAGQGSVQLSAGWGSNGQTAQLAIVDLEPTGAPLKLGAAARVDATGIDVSLSLAADLSALGITDSPKVIAELDGLSPPHFQVRFAPLASSGGDGPLIIRVAPDVAVVAGPQTAVDILDGWLLPLAVQAAVHALQPMLGQSLWSGGPTLQAALQAAGILDSGGAVEHSLPNVFDMLANFLAEVATLLDVHLGDLHLRLVNESGRIGLALSGKEDIALGDVQLSMVFGAPAAWGAAAAEGLVLLLLDITGTPQFNLGVQLRGVGIGLSKADGTALIAESFLRLGSVQALLFLELETSGGLHVEHGGAGLHLGGFGLPIGSALGAGGGSNPVASNLLGSGGSGQSGDSQSVNPASDIDVWYWDDPANSGGPLRVLVGGQTGVFWIPVHGQFGPIFINELGLGVTSTSASMVIDGGVSFAGLSAEVDELSITVPYAHVSDPSKWSLDLKGLAVGYSGPGISIAGGLAKFDGPPVEYDGMLLIEVAGIGAIVIGAYSVVGTGSDQYTSFAIFGGVFIPVGLPPIINLTGFALGLGYNRRLIVPDDMNQIPNFMLVKALDDPEAIANDPMQALVSFREQVPPSRGALWLAVGLRGTSFEIVNITAVVYVALDKGVDIGLLGVARMALPSSDAAIVSIELALKARFSSSEGLFSVQAQLTDNSWLITSDCELTGGFAFFMWFPRSQFLLTIGGYHPAFKPLPEYPVVPRLGFRWTFAGIVHIKGESYFALTNTAVMAGVRLDASYGPDWLQLWFTAYTDVLVSWDPFHYELDVGVSVGARLHIEVCFFACVTIDISISIGATLELSGPPFHGTVTVDLDVTSVTVPFGDDSLPPPPAKPWSEFVATYVKSNDDNGSPIGGQVARGLLPAEPAGAPVAPGTSDQPWRLSAEWSLQTQTRMPTRGFMFQTNTAQSESDMGSAVFGQYDNLSATYAFDLAPMHVHASDVTALHRIVLSVASGGTFVDLVVGTDLDATLFVVTPIIGQVSEATYHLFPDFKPPAAANTLPVLSGIRLDGNAGLYDESAVVPIGTLVDASNFRPLPFAHRTPEFVAAIIASGVACAAIQALASSVTTLALLAATAGIVGPSVVDIQTLRSDCGLRPSGYGPVALRSLTTRRTSAPVLSALSEGYTLDAPGIGVPPVLPSVGSVEGVALTEPRLRSVLQRSLLAAAAAPSIRTTVPATVLAPQPLFTEAVATQARTARVPVIDVRSTLVTAFDAPGFALVTAPATAARALRPARSSRTLRSAAQGAPLGRATSATFDALATAVVRDGVEVRSGVTHVWELPGGARSWQLQLAGASAVRVTELSSVGTVLRDAEFALGERTVELLPGTAMLAVSALGVLDKTSLAAKAPDGAAASVVARVAAPGATHALGWQLDGEAVQVGPTTLLTRGSVLTVTKPVGGRVRHHVAANGIVTLSRALLDQDVVSTRFPAGVTVLGVLVDRPDQSAVTSDSVTITTDGAAIAHGPLQVVAGNRVLFLYDLASMKDAVGPDSESAPVDASVGLRSGLAMAGVVAGFGTAAGWAASLAGSTLTQLVPAEHLTTHGAVRARLIELEVARG